MIKEAFMDRYKPRSDLLVIAGYVSSTTCFQRIAKILEYDYFPNIATGSRTVCATAAFRLFCESTEKQLGIDFSPSFRGSTRGGLQDNEFDDFCRFFLECLKTHSTLRADPQTIFLVKCSLVEWLVMMMFSNMFGDIQKHHKPIHDYVAGSINDVFTENYIPLCYDIGKRELNITHDYVNCIIPLDNGTVIVDARSPDVYKSEKKEEEKKKANLAASLRSPMTTPEQKSVDRVNTPLSVLPEDRVAPIKEKKIKMGQIKIIMDAAKNSYVGGYTYYSLSLGS